MGIFDGIKKAISPRDGWANPMSYGPQLVDKFSGEGKGFESMIPGIGDAQAQSEANATNIKLAAQNRQWTEMMSNTAYQRAMADMEKAGLNPILAYQQGGASVPSVGAATVNPESKSGLANAALSAYTGISAARSQQQQANTAQAQAESTVQLQASAAAQNVANTAKTQAETAKTIETIKSEKVKRQLMESQIPLNNVKSSAASLVEKGTHKIDNMFDSLLKSAAKPSTSSDGLHYKNPLNPKNWFNDDKQPTKPASKTGNW